MKKINVILVILLSISCMGFSFMKKELSKEKILEIAINRANELGFTLNQVTPYFDEGNKRLKEHSRNSGVSTYNEKKEEWVYDAPSTPTKKYPELEDRNYQAVYFAPKEMQLGGDLWIFIDKNTGEVISYVFGK